MAFVKLDVGILDSTLWVDKDAREVFITALLMAYPQQFDEPQYQLNVRSLEKTGFVVQPGWYGFVPAAGIGIVRRCGIADEAGLCALERLGAPEMDSRTPDHEGRRLARIDGGFVVLNYILYREKDHTAAERQKRYRERKLQRDSVTVGQDNSKSKQVTRNVTQAEVEVEDIQKSRSKALREDIEKLVKAKRIP